MSISTTCPEDAVSEPSIAGIILDDAALVSEHWRRLIEIHNHAKSVFLLAEEFEPKFKDFIQPAMELRHALEHAIRAQAAIVGINGNGMKKDPEYIRHSFDKAIGHEYRAFFDAADWLSVCIRERIQTNLSPYPHECIEAALPEYYPTISPRISQLTKEIAAIRGAKDVARDSDIEAMVGKSHEAIAEVGKYRKVLDELIQGWDKVQAAMPGLMDWHKRNRRSTINTWFWSALIGGLICAVVTAAVMNWLGFTKQ